MSAVNLESEAEAEKPAMTERTMVQTIEYFVWRFFVVAAAVGVAYLAAGFIAIVLGWIQIIC
ncbi:MAG TPA: hypothetical protein VGH90_10050 [Chthoniobacteraceae bacterium]|jgi:hypothetical protein